MRGASTLLVAGLLLTVALLSPTASALTTVRACGTGTYPAPVFLRCTFAVGRAWKSIAGADFKHQPCVKGTVATPCYAGRMWMQVSWARGIWEKTCDTIQLPNGQTVQKTCVRTGALPPGGSSFAVQCQSNYLVPLLTVRIAGGVGVWKCYVTLRL
jgi:hypothetical protein